MGRTAAFFDQGSGVAAAAEGSNVAGPIRTDDGDSVGRTAIYGVEGGVAIPLTTLGVDPATVGEPGGPAGPLDANGEIPLSQMPIDGLNYQGAWDASTNTPTLADGVGTAGDMYRVSVAGSQDLGSGVLVFEVGDHVIYEGAIWQQLDPAQVIDWGDIQGTLANQTDLQAALDAKVDTTGDTMTGPLDITTTASIPLSTTNTSTGGAGLLSVSDNGAAVLSGSRLGYKLFGGATDDQHTIYHSAGAEAFAAENWTPTAAGTALRFDVTANGTVARVTALEIHDDGTVDVKSNKLIAIADGTDPTDGVNYGQLAVERISGTVDLQLDGEDLIWPSDVTTGKIRLYNSTPGSTNTYYGFGILNQTFVYQVDGSGSTHKFQSVDGSDNAVVLFEISDANAIVAHRDLHMSEQKVVNIADGTSPRDAVNRQQLDTKADAIETPADQTANATLQNQHPTVQLCDATAGAITLSLVADTPGKTFTVKKTDASANTVTISPPVPIDGQGTAVLANQYDYITIVRGNADNWHTIAST